MSRVDEPRRRDRLKNDTKRGLRVANADAVIPIPGSTVDPSMLIKSTSEILMILTDGDINICEEEIFRRGQLIDIRNPNYRCR